MFTPLQTLPPSVEPLIKKGGAAEQTPLKVVETWFVVLIGL